MGSSPVSPRDHGSCVVNIRCLNSDGLEGIFEKKFIFINSNTFKFAIQTNLKEVSLSLSQVFVA